MTEISRFFDTGGPYSSADVAEALRDFQPDGVVRQPTGNPLIVSVGTGLSVNVAAGRALIRGRWYKNDAVVNLAIAANSSGSLRYDAVVLRLDESTDAFSLAVVTGTPGSGLVPTPSRIVGGVWELTLGYAVVPNAAATPSSTPDLRAYGRWQGDPLGIPNWCGYTGPYKPRHLRLSYISTSNQTGNMTNGAYTTIGTSQNFTVSDYDTLLLVVWNCAIASGNPSVGNVSSAIYIDSTTRHFAGGGYDSSGQWGANAWAGGGALILSGLAPGVHTLEMQITSGNTGQGYIHTPSSQPIWNNMEVDIMEIARR